MKIFLILTILSALISITDTKTREKCTASLQAQMAAYLKCGTTADTTKCSSCINQNINLEVGKSFEGYMEDCVKKCKYPGLYTDLKP